MDDFQTRDPVNDKINGDGPVGANQCLDMNQAASHGAADSNSPQHKPWARGEKTQLLRAHGSLNPPHMRAETAGFCLIMRGISVKIGLSPLPLAHGLSY